MEATTLSAASVYVGTYGKYNNGSLSGAWLDLSDYSDKKEFYEACRKLHKDEEDAEYMFQDWELINGEIAKNKGSYFGLYLYYTYRFQNHTFNTVEEIDEARNFIGSFDEASRQSGIYVKMQEGLDKFARCATGSVAPAITGIDLKGNSVSLNDFKGKYVLVGFWFAGCSWCRKETPYLLKTYNAFKDKGFTIYGVSTDRREEDWKKAIEEDKSYWNQVLLQKDDVKDVLESYCIVGFPHIILVDPEGKIVAKELRGDDLYNTVEKFVNGAK